MGDEFVAPWDVTVVKVVANDRSPSTAITVFYTVVGTSVPFTSTAAAFAFYSDALSTSVVSGAFEATLSSQAASNTAVYLANSDVISMQPRIQNTLFTVSPTAVPSYSPGSATPAPTSNPTPSPTQSPSSSPTYRAGRPTPSPTTIPTESPTIASTLSSAIVSVTQVQCSIYMCIIYA